MNRLLIGKAALVTGGSRGIGAAIALALADAGANVAFTFASSAEKADDVTASVRRAGVQALPLRCDHAQSGATEAAVADTAREFGRLDILVNNVGIAVPAPLDGSYLQNRAALEKLWAVNFAAHTVATACAAMLMPEGGSIIMIGSALADRAMSPGLADYTAAKSALASFSRTAARELSARKIRVNVIQPGAIATEMNPSDGPFAPAQKAMIPSGEFGQPEDVAAVVVFLAGSGARYVTGSVINVDGGFSV